MFGVNNHRKRFSGYVQLAIYIIQFSKKTLFEFKEPQHKYLNRRLKIDFSHDHHKKKVYCEKVKREVVLRECEGAIIHKQS